MVRNYTISWFERAIVTGWWLYNLISWSLSGYRQANSGGSYNIRWQRSHDVLVWIIFKNLLLIMRKFGELWVITKSWGISIRPIRREKALVSDSIPHSGINLMVASINTWNSILLEAHTTTKFEDLRLSLGTLCHRGKSSFRLYRKYTIWFGSASTEIFCTLCSMWFPSSPKGFTYIWSYQKETESVRPVGPWLKWDLK